MPALNRLNYDACGERLSPGIYFKPIAMTNGFTIDLTLGEHHKMQLLLITNKPNFSVSFSLRDVIKNVCNWLYNKEKTICD